jgi:hypothetical protein
MNDQTLFVPPPGGAANAGTGCCSTLLTVHNKSNEDGIGTAGAGRVALLACMNARYAHGAICRHGRGKLTNG